MRIFIFLPKFFLLISSERERGRVQQVVDLRGNVRSALLLRLSGQEPAAKGGRARKSLERRRRPHHWCRAPRHQPAALHCLAVCHTLTLGAIHCRLYYAIQPLKQPDGGAPTPGLLLALAATRQALRCSPPPPPPPPPPPSPRDSTKVRLASSSDGQLSRPLTFSS